MYIPSVDIPFHTVGIKNLAIGIAEINPVIIDGFLDHSRYRVIIGTAREAISLIRIIEIRIEYQLDAGYLPRFFPG